MIIYFRGCVVREKLKYISDATETILKQADIDFTILPNETCCGSVLLRTGFRDDAQEVMKDTLKKLEESIQEEDKILVSCSGCYNRLKNDYKELFGVELDVIHTSELINQLIADGKLSIKKTPNKVTCNDPCHLGRHSGLYEEPRKAIIETCNLVEMDHNRENSRCYGAGAGVKSAYPDTALLIAQRRIKDAKDTKDTKNKISSLFLFSLISIFHKLNSKKLIISLKKKKTEASSNNFFFSFLDK